MSCIIFFLWIYKASRYFFFKIQFTPVTAFGQILELLEILNWIIELWNVVIDIDKKSFVIWCDQIPLFSIFLGFILKDALFWLWTRSFASCLHCCLIQDHLTFDNFLLVVVLWYRHNRDVCLNFSWSNDVPKY